MNTNDLGDPLVLLKLCIAERNRSVLYLSTNWHDVHGFELSEKLNEKACLKIFFNIFQKTPFSPFWRDKPFDCYEGISKSMESKIYLFDLTVSVPYLTAITDKKN